MIENAKLVAVLGADGRGGRTSTAGNIGRTTIIKLLRMSFIQFLKRQLLKRLNREIGTPPGLNSRSDRRTQKSVASSGASSIGS